MNNKKDLLRCEAQSNHIRDGNLNICEKYNLNSHIIDIIYDSTKEIEKNEVLVSNEWKSTVLNFHSGFGYSKYTVKNLGNDFYEVDFDINPYSMKQDNLLAVHSSDRK